MCRSTRWRRHVSLALRLVILSALILAMAGLQTSAPQEGLNVFYLLDRSESIPPPQHEASRRFVNESAALKKKTDAAGVLVFGAEAAIESNPSSVVDLLKINAVIPVNRTDIAAAVRLATAAFPESGQKRIVLLSDGNENVGEALAAVRAARPLGVTVDVIPLGAQRGADVSVQRLSLPPNLKRGQPFDARIFIQSDRAQRARMRLYRNDQALGEQEVELAQGKNLFTFPQKLPENGFYTYRVEVEAEGDTLPQNNRGSGFTQVRGEPRVLLVSAQPSEDRPLIDALRSTRLELRVVDQNGLPEELAELQSYDTIFLSNVAAGDLGERRMKMIESAVRDFGVGLVCVGGDQTYLAGAYKGTPLEDTLPVNMELDSKKVLPPGAVALVMHGMEFANGNQVARDCAIGVLEALGAQDEMGVVLWDGSERWLFPLGKVGDKKAMRRQIAGMNQGDLPSFEGVMKMAHQGLKASSASLKHIIVFSDGDPAPPSVALMNEIVANRITVSTVLISGHAGPATMQMMADLGQGRFHDVVSPADLPQIFIKETMVILKSAISEEPFQPKLVSMSEPVRGIAAGEYPILRGFVSTTPKPRAEVPLLTEKGDPLLAHWQYGLGRSAAFTSDARARWATAWLGWGRYQQFWTQLAQWSLRRVENADFTSEFSIDRGEGHLTVEAVDAQGNYRNFLDLQTIVVGPKGERQTVRLEQTSPGRYEAHFPAREVGAYMLNLAEMNQGLVRASQALGASVDYSPEFLSSESNLNLLQQLAKAGEARCSTRARRPIIHFFTTDKKRFSHATSSSGCLSLPFSFFPSMSGCAGFRSIGTNGSRPPPRCAAGSFSGNGPPAQPHRMNRSPRCSPAAIRCVRPRRFIPARSHGLIPTCSGRDRIPRQHCMGPRHNPRPPPWRRRVKLHHQRSRPPPPAGCSMPSGAPNGRPNNRRSYAANRNRHAEQRHHHLTLNHA